MHNVSEKGHTVQITLATQTSELETGVAYPINGEGVTERVDARYLVTIEVLIPEGIRIRENDITDTCMIVGTEATRVVSTQEIL